MKTFTKFLAGAVTIMALAMIGCQNDTDTHEHTYSTVWSNDATSHWHPATCEHTSEVSEKTAHTFDKGVVTKEATETETGIKTYTCTVCKYEKTESIAVLPHTHKYSTEWTSDATNHWHAATCGHDVKSDEATHTFGEGVVTKEATETKEGEKTFTCTVCGYKKIESIAVLPHTHKFATEWTNDATNHWHVATCEHTKEVSDKAAHTFGEAVVTKPATETEEGVKTYTCTVCNYQKTEPIEKIIKITSIFIPTAGTSKANNTVTATIIGKNFTSESVNSGMYSLTCTTDSIINGSVFTYVNESTINVTLTIPGSASSYDVTITNGTSSANGIFVVRDNSSIAVGDIIYTDGTTSSKDAELTSGKTPVAVVAGLNKNGAMLGLGLKQSSSSFMWAPEDTTGYNTKFTGIIAKSDKTGTGAGSTATITGDTDGSDNWEYVKSRDPKGTANAQKNYPAFNFAATYATTAGITGEIAEGWYMPSIAELCELYKNKDILNDSLSKCGGTRFRENYYWSSSQYDFDYGNAWILDFSDGYLDTRSMYYNRYVCCVRAF